MLANMIRRVRGTRDAQRTHQLSIDETYRRLVLKADRTDGEEQELEQIILSRGIPTEQVERDAEAAEEHHRQRTIADGLPQAQEWAMRAKTTIDAHDRETERLLTELKDRRQQQRDGLEAQRRSATDAVKRSTAAAAGVEAIKEQHWGLFGRRDPRLVAAEKRAEAVQLSRIRYLGHAVDGKPDNVLAINTIVEGNHATHAGRDMRSNYDIRPAPGQDPREFALLKRIYDEALAGRHPTFAYLVPAKHSYPRLSIIAREGYVFTIDDVLAAKRDPNSVGHFVLHPGQGFDELDKLVARWRKAWDGGNKDNFAKAFTGIDHRAR